MREYHAALSEKIVQPEGVIDHIAGDRAMVIFNDPVPCDNPAERAVRMAVEMRAAIAALQKKWVKRGFNLGFGIRVSLGYATLGGFGSEKFFHYGGFSTVLNLAASLLNCTEPLFCYNPRRCQRNPANCLKRRLENY